MWRIAMKPPDPEHKRLISPSDRLEVLPIAPDVSKLSPESAALRAEHFRDTPDFELDLPGGTHHLVALYLHPPEKTGFWTEGVDWEGTPPPGSILVLPAEHSRRAFWRGPTESVHVHLAPQLISQVAAGAFELDPSRIELPAAAALIDPTMQAAILGIDAERSTDAPGGRLLTESLGNVLAVQLIRRALGDKRRTDHPRGGLPRRKLRAAIEYIEHHLNSDVSLDALAAVAHLSAYHFARQFKASTGLPPHQYMITRRIERAKELIRGKDDISLAEVAARVGFWDQGHFTRHFKRVVGVTPKRFR
jgi:AraC family transcriptional regulator